ncbi:iron-containing alcohol dehydrogenase [Treponema phagedenis]|uniref:Iron-containing alcohol dehydrogenase n=1 Tax=Treponema phagedenis TaxID=162 RepID=A0AAE6IT57_TREPH|nr:iron-containing alcohol dehydrogenase [Treponema phagedenis]NVP25357.1 iron-containing alcohol dehydrogenase [Treponema phagedenis]QEJ94848.1 iron-containing alcohol dehydrogenase [Treponema phagedenis]QEJ97834.1 iron-containing alcohol dehydrogenase [Treponema phagedenis]QEK03401.1 iron-containing alcohol dehydrogenase [Treponema phagedenis]QEK09029.1 iron-containing alcohol dehydrogenase [Treponema phagedenis]
MSIMNFSVPREIIYGENALDHLAKLKGKKAAIVTGGSSMKRFGFLDKSAALLKKAGIESIIIDGVEPNPSVKTVIEGGKKMAEFEPDWIVAIGGGSALDAAKVMWCFYEHPAIDFTDIITPGSMPSLRNKAKLICIPSTSGTASEITAFSVITDTENHIKYPIVAADMVPDIAILDPALPACMPPHITANTGMDVFAHAIEAFASTAATSFTDPYAIEALRLVIKYLPRAYADGKDMEARTHMHNASTLAGMAFTNASLGLVHSLAHKIGGEFGVTHGLANAILMPYIIDFNRKYSSKYELAEKRLGVADIAEQVRELNKKLDIPLTFKDCTEVDFNEAKFKKVLDRMSENAHGDPCTLTNPGNPTVADVKMIYEAAYYGKKIS